MPGLTSDIHAGNECEIVITGISGRFPECDNIEEFKQHLYAGTDLVTEDGRRWTPGLYGIPKRAGKLKNLQYFDAGFFGMHEKLADGMDPGLRMLYETTYEAIVDAGYNPSELKGTRTAVFVAVTSNDACEFHTEKVERVSGYSTLGNLRCMFANRLSYNFDLKGPSFSIDAGCSSSMAAFYQGFEAIRSGKCEAAIVGGVQLCLKPMGSLQLHSLRVLNADGACKTFDASADGMVRSEGVVSVLLQKRSVARRLYATIVNIGINVDGYKEEGITYPAGWMQKKLIEQVFEEGKINPLDVTYFEAHGTGTKAGDREELNSVADFFCANRREPLLIGSVKSNMGHAESTSGLCGLVKVLAIMETGVIPGNLHFKEPNREIPALLDGRFQVVTKNTPWKKGLAVINCFGVGGSNGHLVLRPNPREKVPPKDTSPGYDIPRLITVSGRTEEAVNAILDQVDKVPRDEEFLSLLAETYKSNIKGHTFRGYSLLGGPGAQREIAKNDGEKRPIWWFFSGMGSQWPGMAKSLYRLDAFRNTLHRCAAALRPHGVDLIDIVMNGSADTFEQCDYAYVSVLAVQIGLADVLTSLGIKPDFIVGHSVGEAACAYADNTISAEQVTLLSYFRGRALIESGVAHHSMAVVGLTWEETKRRAPAEIILACHNSKNSVSISGPTEAITKFVAELKSENIFATEVKTAGVASHSKYVADALPLMKKYFEKVISNPKPRSHRWISTSIPEERWGEPIAKLSSAEYQINNVISPVLFAEVLPKISQNAIVIEIGPDHLFQSILRRSLAEEVTIVGLNKRSVSDSLSFFFNTIGKLYNAGLELNMSSIFKPVKFPVSRGTQHIAPLVKWDHSSEWTVPKFEKKGNRSGDTVTKFDLTVEKDAFLAGNSIDGRVLLPASRFITLVWKTFAKLQGTSTDDLPVTIENIQFHRQITLPNEGPVHLSVNVFKGSGQFEVCEESSVVVSGRIATLEDPDKAWVNLPSPCVLGENDALPLQTSDVYKELRLRGYNYRDRFCGIVTSDSSGTFGRLRWVDDWITFIDTMMQFYILGMSSHKTFLPKYIQRININPRRHKAAIDKLKSQTDLGIIVNRDIDIIQAGGVEIHRLETSFVRRQLNSAQAAPVIERYGFVPLNRDQAACEEGETKRVATIAVLLQLISQNAGGTGQLKVVEVEGDRSALLAPLVVKVFDSEIHCVLDVTLSSTEPLTESLKDLKIKQVSAKKSGPFVSCEGTHLIITTNLSKRADPVFWKKISESLKPGGFVLAEEVGSVAFSLPHDSGLIAVAKMWVDKYSYTLLRKVETATQFQVITVNRTDFSWIEPLKTAMKECKGKEERIVLVSQSDMYSGLIGIAKSLIREPGGLNVRFILILDPKAPAFSVTDPLYRKQLQLDLIINVLRNASTNEWGTYQHAPLDVTKECPSRSVEHAYIDNLSYGDFTSLRWIEKPLYFSRSKRSPSQEICSVYYASITMRDFNIVMGKLNADNISENGIGEGCKLGREFSGYNSRGRRVMGVVASGTLATTVVADPDFLWEVPDNWTLEQAATVPRCYSISYYAMVVRGGMRKGDSVLIRDGAAGVGQAAIAIALHAGCEVYTTASSLNVCDFLKTRYPELTDGHIANSNESRFEKFILHATNGRGVDLVLNFPSKDAPPVSGCFLAKRGRYLDLSNNTPLDAGVLLHNRTFHNIRPEAFLETTGKEKAEIAKLVSEGIKSGTVRPLSSTVFSTHSLEEAFKCVADGKQVGEVLIQIRSDEDARSINPMPKFVPAVPRTYMNPEKSYVIIGGLGGVGLELADWLIKRGATKLVLTSRSGVKTGYQALCLRRWREGGVQVIVSSKDVRTEKATEQLLAECNKLGQVGGIFQLAVVVRDAYLENQTARDFSAVTSCKIDATINLDKASRSLCPQLDYFVTFSSITSGRGLAGQVPYGLANSAMERICEVRKADGLPAVAIQWGIIGDVGMVFDTMGKGDDFRIGHSVPQCILSVLNTLDLFLQQPDTILSSFVPSDKTGSPVAETSESAFDAVVRILEIKNMKTVRANLTFAEMGVDSIMVSEIKDTLQQNHGLYFNSEEIRGLTFKTLQSLTKEEDTTSA